MRRFPSSFLPDSAFISCRFTETTFPPPHSATVPYILLPMARLPAKPTEREESGVLTKTKAKTKKPSLYKVLLLNDDYTPMEFVVHVLEVFFSKSREDAYRIMLHVHQKGVGVCGVYTFEVAETKVTQVMDFAKQHSHPLQCTMEKE
jgi:ATP-dependent Clp protease adaptor protein ClpS